jgi:hypothetical protein
MYLCAQSRTRARTEMQAQPIILLNRTIKQFSQLRLYRQRTFHFKTQQTYNHKWILFQLTSLFIYKNVFCTPTNGLSLQFFFFFFYKCTFTLMTRYTSTYVKRRGLFALVSE